MLRMIFQARWTVHAFLTVVFLGFAVVSFLALSESEEEKAEALRRGIPEAVSLNAFDPERDVHPADEVHVVGWINFDHNYQLTETRKRKVSSYDVTRRMFVLFGPDDDMGSTMARAVILLDDGAVDRFQAEAMAGFVEQRDERLVFRLNGTAERSPELYKMANDALKKEGLTKAPGFQFIEIWGPKGREHDLQPDKDGPKIFAGGIAGIGVAFLLIAVWRFRVPYVAPVAVPGRTAVMSNEKPVASQGKARKALVLKVGVAVVALAVIGFPGHLDKVLVLLPLLVIAAIYLGMRQMGRAVSSGLGRALGHAPETKAEKPAMPALPAWAMVSKPVEAKAEPTPVNRDVGPVQSLPTMGERLSGLGSSGRFAKWVPFALGLVVVVVSPKLIDQLDVPLVAPIGSLVTEPKVAAPIAQMATAPAPKAPVVVETAVAAVPTAAPAPETPPVAAPAVQPESALGIDISALQGMGSTTLLILLAVAALILGAKVFADWRSGRAIAAEPIERWEKIARQARAGRSAA